MLYHNFVRVFRWFLPILQRIWIGSVQQNLLCQSQTIKVQRIIIYNCFSKICNKKIRFIQILRVLDPFVGDMYKTEPPTGKPVLRIFFKSLAIGVNFEVDMDIILQILVLSHLSAHILINCGKFWFCDFGDIVKLHKMTVAEFWSEVTFWQSFKFDN